ncbi:programmed cell death protein 2 [Phlyctochytrium arcticum]|nr:programmed cell death protein 2 [Phlyctochytrium arcticum]
MPVVQLGFAEEPEDGPLTYDINDYPNKVGGVPFWLNTETVLKSDDLLCGVCGKIMALLAQFYTPEDEPTEAYHRLILIFCCRNGECHKNNWKGCFKVFRNQLPEINKFYNPAEGQDRCEKSAQLCSVCALDSPKQCSKCGCVRYCSREHQLLDWTRGKHKEQCPRYAADPSYSPESPPFTISFPELEIVSEDEPPAEDVAASETERVESAVEGHVLEKLADVKIAEDDIEDLEETEVDVDKAFLKFQKRISREPEQVVRYARVSYADDDPEPLWVGDAGKPAAEDIPPCPHCKGRRSFEFQIMPQLLNVLQIDHFTPNALDWGTLMVFSCGASCQPEGVNYMEEIVWRQMFSEQGMGDSARRAMEERASSATIAAAS